MPVSGLSFDLFSALQFVVTALVLGVGLVQVIKATASRYFIVDARFEDGDSHGHADDAVDRQTMGPAEATSSGAQMSGAGATSLCFVCGESGKKICSGCKAVRYCSTICQAKHWKDGHKLKCKDLKSSNSRDSKSSSTCKALKQANKVLFPYDEFVKLFNWNNPDLLPPCGLLNCGNSCFANVVLQCLSCTRPLVAYLLTKDHTRKCNRNDWCFLCELECHVDRVNRSLHPFSPINILSRLPNIGGNLGYGKQEDAHEFMRFFQLPWSTGSYLEDFNF